MRKWHTTKLINRPDMKFYLVIDYTLPSTWLKSTQAEIQNDGGRLGLVISLKTRSRLSHLIKRESLMFSLRQYCLDFLIFTTKDSKFHFSPTFTSNLFFSIHEFAHRALWFVPVMAGFALCMIIWRILTLWEIYLVSDLGRYLWQKLLWEVSTKLCSD